MKTSKQIREAFINFYKDKQHAIIPGVSLVPQNDPSLLFVNSGMFPLVNYLMGQKHPLGNKLANIQRCVRTEDLEEVGDTTHHTLFEMIGNWSLNDYFKEEQLPNFLDLYVNHFGLDINRIYVTVFKGNKSVPKDQESIDIWQKLFEEYGLKADYTENPEDITKGNFRIFGLSKEQGNWWQRGEAVGELGGPSSELFFDMQAVSNPEFSGNHSITDDSGRFVELGNSVFLQYKLNSNLEWEEMATKNIDFGGGFERIVAAVQNVKDNYDTDLFQSAIKKIEELSGKVWKDEDIDDLKAREIQNKHFRAIADHIRASVFIIADGVVPSNKEQGYILRRIIRRMIRQAKFLEINDNFARELAGILIAQYEDSYPHIKENESLILNELEKEEIKFRRTLERGLKEFQKITGKGQPIDGKIAFNLFETYGFPLEMIIEEIEDQKNDDADLAQEEINMIISQFNREKELHQDQSRQGAEQKFTGGLADHSEETTRLHTAHHLLLAALQKIVSPNIHQRGSNITKERLRIDFEYAEKLSEEQIQKIEELVNLAIDEGWEVQRKELPIKEAESLGAEMEFGAKYGEIVSVYFVQKPDGEIFSKEFCGGPHVTNTKELAKSGKFKIIKEQSSSAGVRRIKAVLA